MLSVQSQTQLNPVQSDLLLASKIYPQNPSLTFDELILSINEILGVDKPLETHEIDHKKLMELMKAYTSSEKDWEKFAFEDPNRPYTRNGVEDFGIDGVNANLLLLVWNPSEGSVIHDHAKAHCVMKILKGTLTEELFEDPGEVNHDMVAFKTTDLNRDVVAHIRDDIGLHRISNKTDEIAISLHLYTPPYAKKYGCHIFDDNGVRHHVEMANLFSWKGELQNVKNHSTC